MGVCHFAERHGAYRISRDTQKRDTGRKDYPKLSAYVENRCNPTRNGLNEILPILDNKLMLLYDSKLGIKKEVFGLINLMDNMHISGRSASSSRNMHIVH